MEVNYPDVYFSLQYCLSWSKIMNRYMEKINEYIEEHKERFLEDLFELIRIPSISSLKEHKLQMYKAAEKFKNYFMSVASDGVTVEVKSLHGGQGYVCPVDLPANHAAESAYEEVFGCKPIPVRSGGSIPIISVFEEIQGIKSLLMGFGLESDAIHSPNENFPLENFYYGI